MVEKYLSEENYLGLYDYYERFGYKNAQHELMGAHFVNTIVDILAEFDNYKHPFDYYEAYVWSGSLAKTISYAELSQTKKDSIEYNYTQEYHYGDKSCVNAK